MHLQQLSNVFLLVLEHIFYTMNFTFYMGIRLNNYDLKTVAETVTDHKIYIYWNVLFTVIKIQIS